MYDNESKTSRRSGSGSNKNNKRHKYTLDEAWQVMLEFDDESNYWDLSDKAQSTPKYYSSDCNQPQTGFDPDPSQNKQLDDTWCEY